MKKSKVIYKQRRFLDKYRCIDTVAQRYFIYSWVVGALTYFKENEFNTFSVATEDIISIEA